MTGEDPGAVLRRPDVSDLVEIGRGGFGVVYRARQEQFRRDVAVKVISARLDERARARFTQECRALGQLSGHPHIVPVYDGGIDPDEHGFLVMPFLAGGSLSDRLARSGPLGWREVTDIGIRLCGALQTAHEAGILHRDVKPANVLVDEYGGPRLADFGQARFADTSVTRTGAITATPAYAAPEIINGQPATSAADVYALAATLTALVRGRAPFDDGSHLGSIAPVLYRVLHEAPPDLRTSGVPEPLSLVLAQAMAKDPAHRPETALALGIALQRGQQALGLPVTPLSVAGTQLVPPPAGAAEPGGTTRLGPGAGPPAADRTAVTPFPHGSTAMFAPGQPDGVGFAPTAPGPRRSRRPLMIGLAVVLVVVLAVGTVLGVQRLNAPQPAAGLVGSDLLLAPGDLPGGGWARPESSPETGPLASFLITGADLLTCLALPVVLEGSGGGALDARDVTVADRLVRGDVGVQTAGVITGSAAEAEVLVDVLNPPGRCPDLLQSLATGLATDVDFAGDRNVTFEALDLPDLPGSVRATGERISLPLSGSDTGESTFQVELVFLTAGSAVAGAGLAAYGDVPDEVRTAVVEQLADLLTE